MLSSPPMCACVCMVSVRVCVWFDLFVCLPVRTLSKTRVHSLYGNERVHRQEEARAHLQAPAQLQQQRLAQPGQHAHAALTRHDHQQQVVACPLDCAHPVRPAATYTRNVCGQVAIRSSPDAKANKQRRLPFLADYSPKT